MSSCKQTSIETTSGLQKAFQYAAAVTYALAGESPALGIFTAKYLSDMQQARKATPSP